MGKADIKGQLKKLFDPDTVAVIGASENPAKLGYHVMKSLKTAGYKGRIIPVNPRSKEIMGLRAYATISEISLKIDLVIVVVPAKVVSGIFEECQRNGIKRVVLITAGFKEIDDPAGGKLQDALALLAEKGGIAVIGPNTFGIVNVHRNLNASFTPEFSKVEKGPVALVSQSGGISHLLAFMAMRQHVRLSKIAGLGNRLNADFADMLQFLMDDRDTKSIALYLEGLNDPRELLEAASSNRGKKPIVAYKTGRAKMGDRASLSHTGSMAGKQEIYEGALRQAGILCVNNCQDLLDFAQVLSQCPPLEGPRVAILTAQAGPGMAACDVCEKENLEMASFSSETQALIHDLLPPLALRRNPVDMGPAWYDSSAINGIIEAVMEDENVDGIILLMMFASANREAVPNLSGLLRKWQQKKPLIGCIVSPPGIWDEVVLGLERVGALVNMPTPEGAARAMACLWQYGKSLNQERNFSD